MSDPCSHQWRVNPHILLLSHPPQQQLRCADCGALSNRPVPGHVSHAGGVEDWPLA